MPTANRSIEYTTKGQLDAQATINDAIDEIDVSLPYLVARVTDVDGKVAAATTLYTVPAGKRLIVIEVVMRTTAASGVSANPSISLGGNSPNFADFLADGSRDLDTVGNINLQRLGTGNSTSYASGTNFSAKINTGATGTTLTIAYDVIGYLV